MLPIWYDVAWAIACMGVYIAIAAPTVTSIVRSSHGAWLTKVSWIVFALVLPPVALILWLLVGKPRALSA